MKKLFLNSLAVCMVVGHLNAASFTVIGEEAPLPEETAEEIVTEENADELSVVTEEVEQQEAADELSAEETEKQEEELVPESAEEAVSVEEPEINEAEEEPVAQEADEETVEQEQPEETVEEPEFIKSETEPDKQTEDTSAEYAAEITETAETEKTESAEQTVPAAESEQPAAEEPVEEQQETEETVEADNETFDGSTYSDATPITVGRTVSGRLTEDNNREVYKIVLSSSGRLHLTYTTHDMEKTELSLYQDVKNSESYLTSDNPALNTTNYDFDLIAGTYYLHVQSYNRYNDSYLGTYSFTTSFSSAGETFAEPNNTYSNASQITVGNTVKGQLAVNDKIDVYAFTLNTSGRLTLTYTTSQIEKAEINLYQDDNNTENYINYYAPALNTTTYVYDLAPGKYYLHVGRYTSDLSHEGAYSFKTSFVASGEKFTGANNTYSAASPISFNQTVRGHLALNDSEDVYALTLTSKKTVNLTFSTSQLEKASVSVYVDKNNTESYKTSATMSLGTTNLSLKDYPAGKYYIHVERYSSNAENLGTYSIRAEGAGGWMKSNGKWWYQYGDGGYPRNKWEQIGGKWYHFDSQGYMETGWKKINNVWYYMEGSGAMVTGWKSISGTWYYFKGSGAMVTGWQKINNVWYYFNASGAMQTGWKKISNTWYYFRGSGAMQTGWLKVGGIWYYFESSGAMVTGSRRIGNKTYRFNSNGECLNP